MKFKNILSYHQMQMINFVSISFLIINALIFLVSSAFGLSSILDGNTANSYARYATKIYLKKMDLEGVVSENGK